MRNSRGRPRHPDVLTPAEWLVVDAVRHGMGNRQIARRRGTSVDAVKFHVANALAKLGLANRAELRHWRGVPFDSALTQGAAAREGAMSERGAPDEGPTRAQRRPEMGAGPPGGAERERTQLGPIGQISRHVSDLPRAVEWYGQTLGLPHLYTFGDLAFFDCGGTRLFLSTAEDGVTADESVLYFRVDDIQAAYEELGARGITFDGAPHMIFRHASGLEEWMAFFKDPDGRFLAIMAQVQS